MSDAKKNLKAWKKYIDKTDSDYGSGEVINS